LKHSTIAWINIYVQGNNEKGSKEKNIKPKIIRDVLLKRKIEELGVKISPWPSKPKLSTSE